ncbi:MAG: HAMP domain-containing sensor histidine kinase [bacterium]|nr:HAMP domain-containing sensor histidine kinase [bacterium]
MNGKRRVSIIWKITIWYTIFLCILAVMVVSVTYLVSVRIIKTSSKNNLITIVEDVAEEIDYEDGILEIDDEIDFLDHGVYVSVYDQENELLLGLLPKNYNPSASYKNDTVEMISISQTDWYVYEKTMRIDNYGVVKIRGLVEVASTFENQSVSTRVLLLMSPVIILIATVGGYLLTKEGFKPVNQMRKTVEQISSGKDLTKRVNLGDGEDELYKLARTFDQMFERLENAFEREKQFTSDVSHELRTPISVIISQCEYAMEQQNSLETNEALKSIYQQTRRMSAMIGQLLVLSRSDKGFQKIVLEEVDLSELLEVIIEDVKEKAEQKDITIYTEISENVKLQGDETMLVRFFLNLLQNAIKYGRKGGYIKITLGKEDEMIFGIIKDNGIGIAKEEQEKIWLRFYQVNPSRSSEIDGNLGLGLSMVRWIAEAHGGGVSVESELGVGSTFRYWFPRTD